MKIKCYSVKEESNLADAQRRLANARTNRSELPHEMVKERIELAEIRRNEVLKAARAAVQGDKIQDALEAVNGKASTHTYTTADEIRDVAKIAEDQLAASGVPLAERAGCTITATSGGAVANSYKNRRNATRIILVRGSGAWYLTEVVGTQIYPAGPGKPSIVLSDKAREAVIRSALAPYA